MIVMGIDPGLASTGVGVIEVLGPQDYRLLHSEFVLTGRGEAIPARLKRIHDLIAGVIERFAPSVVAVESIFFAKNVRSAVLMAHGRGAAVLAASQSGVAVAEYSPLEIKQSVVGKGRATKEQVQRMVEILLNLESAPRSDHETDAIACALCHVFRSAAATRFRPASAPGNPTPGVVDFDGEARRAANKELLAQMRGPRRRRR